MGKFIQGEVFVEIWFAISLNKSIKPQKVGQYVKRDSRSYVEKVVPIEKHNFAELGEIFYNIIFEMLQ